MPLTDVADRIVVSSLLQKLLQELVRANVVANVPVRRCPLPLNDQGVSCHDGAVVLVAEEDATGLPREVVRCLEGDGLVGVDEQVDARWWSNHS
nr:hypothetical protein [Micrococcus sp. FDAARGOS_333]